MSSKNLLTPGLSAIGLWLLAGYAVMISHQVLAQEHPGLVLTSKGIETIREELGKSPLFDRSLKNARDLVDAEIKEGIDVPVPKDMAGGYTHERHKKNFFIMQKAGALFQITGDDKYANYVRDMLLQYADLYPALPLHPQKQSYSRGKLFWQCLNDANWLVYTSQAYDCIYEWLKKDERTKLEKQLFKPYADFLSLENPWFFNRIHNHSAWGNAAVGMIGLVMDDEELINRALFGNKNDNLKKDARDDDGGLIKLPGQTQSGFYAQLDNLFSPNGYYTEGPYYQRYAIYPFIIFAASLQNRKPELNIFGYRDRLLEKAVYALLNLTDSDGEFFPINDAQKGMSYLSRELVTAVDAVFHYYGKNPELLSIAREQNTVTLDNAGLSVSKAISEGKSRPFVRASIELADGKNGDEGGIGILRSGNPENEFSLVMKYTAQGLGHGHFDKLSFSLYDKGDEVIQDYGMARFVNIEQKHGGGYLPENTSFAKQTIAHNTLVVNQSSNFNGDFEEGNKHHSDKYFFDSDNDRIKIMSAKDEHAYPGVSMHRTMALIFDEGFQKPVVIDVFRVNTEGKKQYDLPYYYSGQIIEANFEYNTFDTLNPLGEENGYQHLWVEARARLKGKTAKFQWMANQQFYTITSSLPEGSEVLFGRIGADDPSFNLRRDPVYIIRNANAGAAIFVSAIESHGNYSPVSEIGTNAFGSIENIHLAANNKNYSAIQIDRKAGVKRSMLIISNIDSKKSTHHQLTIGSEKYTWTGPYLYVEK